MFADMGPAFYRVNVAPDGREQYRVLIGLGLAACVVSLGWWLKKHRSVGTVRARLWLLAATGAACLAATAGWVLGNDGRKVNSLAGSVINSLVFMGFALLVVGYGMVLVRIGRKR